MGKLGIYLVAHHPSKEVFLQAVGACRDAAVDFLEVGIPFSDPVADGEVIEKASTGVLKAATMDEIVGAFREAAAIFGPATYAMTYTNIVYCRGLRAFIDRVGPVRGLILADLPLREAARFERRAGLRGVSIIRFLTPESRPEDMELAVKGAKDFIYFVSKRGTTGGPFLLDGPTAEKIAMVRGRGVPVYVGFGIGDGRDVERAFEAADGAIVGTRAVAALERGIGPFREFLASLR